MERGIRIATSAAGLLAMTYATFKLSEEPGDCDRGESLEGATPVCGLVRNDSISICRSVFYIIIHLFA